VALFGPACAGSPFFGPLSFLLFHPNLDPFKPRCAALVSQNRVVKSSQLFDPVAAHHSQGESPWETTRNVSRMKTVKRRH